jgi:hypothetical protein
MSSVKRGVPSVTAAVAAADTAVAVLLLLVVPPLLLCSGALEPAHRYSSCNHNCHQQFVMVRTCFKVVSYMQPHANISAGNVTATPLRSVHDSCVNCCVSTTC